MIAKGTTHDSGGRLATYMITGKPGERAELWQLRGFASDDIKDAFRSVHVMADGTKCQQPFFHVQVRNPEHEHLTREEWARVANRVESKLGLTDQPRAIAFHRDEATGHEHMHIAWSRIDDESMTAKSLPFFKLRLKEVSRELETELGLTPVSSERRGPVMAPSRDEEEQARRLNVELRDVRQTIREAWERSDNGHSFRAALAEEGLTLAKGDKRDFIVIDHEGGMNALGKRILGNSAAEIRTRTADLDRDHLPTIEEARDQITRVPKEAVADRPAPKNAKPAEPEIHEAAVDDIRQAIRQARNASEFSAALDRNGIRLAVVNADEAKASPATRREGEIVAVDQAGQVHRLNQETTGDVPGKADKFLATIDRGELGSIANTQRQIDLETRRQIALLQGGIQPVAPPSLQQASGHEKEPVDWERMLSDPVYRKQVEQAQREQRAAEHHSQQAQQQARDRDRR